MNADRAGALSAPLFPAEPIPVGTRLALQIEYDGSAFSGWQSQPQLPQLQTVQSSLEDALAAIAGLADAHIAVPAGADTASPAAADIAKPAGGGKYSSPLRVHCAGRTDTGVHATAQWVHFDTPVVRSAKAWVVGANAQLPASVRIVDLAVVDASFHARHSATARRYDYLIANTRTAPALLANRVLWVRDPLDAPAMDRALQALLGERDFSAFRAASCQSTTPMRFMEAASVLRQGDYLRLQVTANAFLHHMVRNIVGSTLQVGLGAQGESWLGELLAGADRTVAAATAPPQGLYLSGVRYPARFGLAQGAELPFFPAHDRE